MVIFSSPTLIWIYSNKNILTFKFLSKMFQSINSTNIKHNSFL